MSYELMKCGVTGNELGDAIHDRHTVAISNKLGDLRTYCKIVLNIEHVELSSRDCPIPEHMHGTYYTIVESKVEVVEQNYFR